MQRLTAKSVQGDGALYEMNHTKHDVSDESIVCLLTLPIVRLPLDV